MTDVLGLPLGEALRRLEEEGIRPEVIRTAGFRAAERGSERVIRVSRDGRRLTVARFRDTVETDREET